MFKATSTCGSLKVRLRRLTQAEINAAQNEARDTDSEKSTVEFIINTGETASDSDSDRGTFGMVRAPTPIVISSDEEEEARRGEIDGRRVHRIHPSRQAIENTTRYEEDYNVEEETALTLLADEDCGLEQWLKEIADTEVQATEPEVVDEIEKWPRQTGPATDRRVDQQPCKRQTFRIHARGVWYREV
ncbi:unnamed protein product [Ceratitis capitata]|uniref:(Mediterranean fruit fly) hypothetical protein n=1 Tax=Ceratitis capitata TaxID=7213 RepID=A0A811UGU1_CERCA|nr:unnamed protein product [Ceratitis capitata]